MHVVLPKLLQDDNGTCCRIHVSCAMGEPSVLLFVQETTTMVKTYAAFRYPANVLEQIGLRGD